MEDEILKTIESMLGKDIKIVDCEKTSSVRNEEVLLVNGIQVTLEGRDGDAIKSALMSGQVPSCEMLNQLLYQAGILRQPVQLETSLSVKSSMVTKEEVTVARDGRILDERTSETKEDNFYSSSSKEIWEPVAVNVNKIPKATTTTNVVRDSKSAAAAAVFVNDDPEEEEDEDDDDDEEGSLYTINSNLAATHSTVASKVPIATDTSPATSHLDELISTYLNSSCNTISQHHLPSQSDLKNSASLSCDSGHVDIFNSPSQTNLLQTTNTYNSISSCYDCISSDEADCVSQAMGVPSDKKKQPSSSTSSVFAQWRNAKPASGASKDFVPTSFAKLNSSSSSVAKPQPNEKSSSAKLTGESGSVRKSGGPEQKKPPEEEDTEANDDDNNALVYRDGALVSGSLNALIRHMIPNADYYPESSYIFAFLLSARLFIQPHELLARICEIWDQQQQENLIRLRALERQVGGGGIDVCDDARGGGSAIGLNIPHSKVSPKPQSKTDENSAETNIAISIRSAQKSAQNFIKLLADWIETFPYDFRDERLMQHVRSVTRKCVSIDANLGKEVSRILQSLVRRLTILERYEKFLESISVYPQDNFQCGLVGSCEKQPATASSSDSVIHQTEQHSKDRLPSSSSSSGGQSDNSTSGSDQPWKCFHETDYKSTDFIAHPEVCAHQLTHIELERLSHIGPEEFVQAFAKENPSQLESLSDIKKTRNLESYVQWFNRLSYLVATEIVRHKKKSQRVRVIEFWIEVARECFNIGNFNSLMAIIAGLNMSPISRLKKTWSKVQQAKFYVLEQQMDPTSNFNSYRSTLKAAMWRSEGATNPREKIIIPFFSLLVKDLYFLNEGCSNRLPNNQINFEKFLQVATCLQEFNSWKRAFCPFQKIDNIIMFLQRSNVLNENILSVASFECEPPENAQEKERYKTLKSEILGKLK